MSGAASHAPVSGSPAFVDGDPWLTLEQSGAHVQVSERTLRTEISRGRLRHARVGGRRAIRIRRSWLDGWLEQRSTPIEVRR